MGYFKRGEAEATYSLSTAISILKRLFMSCNYIGEPSKCYMGINRQPDKNWAYCNNGGWGKNIFSIFSTIPSPSPAPINNGQSLK